MRESQISREVQRFLRSIGGAVYSTEQGYRKDRGGTRTSAGIPDLIVFFDEAWTFAELKTEKGRLTTAQDGFRLLCEESFAPWQLWRSVEDAWDWAVAHGIVQSVEEAL